jgi:hypothetical protein
MFAPTAFRPLWPAIFFLPGFLLGGAYLFAAILHRRLRLAQRKRPTDTRLPRPRWRAGEGLMILGLAFVAAGHVTLAVPATGQSAACEASDAREAKRLADVLYDKGEYQRAGACYDAAGDQLRAQRAFLKAVGPNSESAARGIREESDTAKALFNKVGKAFRSTH